MSETVKVSNLKEAIAECPICTEFFNDTVQIPLRMPCCSQAVCDRCLETIARGRTALTCPMCNTSHNLPGGVKYLPKEAMILRFLEALKTERNAVPLCTDCPDDNRAMSKCSHCGVYLCQPCLNAHKRHKVTGDHNTTTFNEMQTKLQSRSSSAAVVKATPELTSKLENISERVERLSRMLTNVDKSKTAAQSLINERSDELVDAVQQRRAILLSQLEDKADKEKTSIKSALDSHKQYQEKLKKASTEKQSPASTTALLQESPTDLKQQRVGVIFTEANVQHILEAVRSAGLVRVVTFTPAERPAHAAETDNYEAINLLPNVFPQSIGSDQTFLVGNKEVECPQVEWEKSLANRDTSVSSTEIRNTDTATSPQVTGCRLKPERKTFTSRPLVIEGQRILLRLNVRLIINSLLQERKHVFETCWNNIPVDTRKSNLEFFNVRILRSKNKQDKVSLLISFLGKVMKKIEIVKNMVGATCDLAHYFLLDGVSKKMHMIDAHGGNVLFSTSCSFDKPLWITSTVGYSGSVEMTHEILSGGKVSLNMEMEKCLANLL